MIQFKILRVAVLFFIAIAILHNSVQSFPISPYRSEGPKWTNEINSKVNKCKAENWKAMSIYLTFYPNWPTVNPHAYGLSEPTTNVIRCEKLIKKLNQEN
jgi:hypothetical protein